MAGEDCLELTPTWHGCRDGMMWFLMLAVDSKAQMGLAIPATQKAEYTTTCIIAFRDRRLKGLRLVSRPLFE